MVDRWTSKPIGCQGGLVLDIDSLLQGTNFPGTARILQNMEPDIAGGYRRINGYTPYDEDEVPGDTGNPITGVKVGYNILTGVFATRRISTPSDDNAIYLSTGTGWSSKLNTIARPGSVGKARFIAYSIFEPVVVQCDGVNPAWKYNGTVDVTINGAGAPANPKYAAVFRARLALAGYGSGSLISLSAPNDDEDFSGAGAVEINVGDVITGLHLFRDDLVIFCERSVKRLTGTTSADFLVEDITTSIGCVSGDTVQEIGGDLIYMSTDGLRSYAGTARIGDVELSLVSKSVQPLIRDILSASYTEDNFSSLCVRKKSQYRLFVNTGDVPEEDTLGILGRLQDSPVTPHGQYEWATLKGIKPYCSDSGYTGAIEVAVFGHPTDGKVYRLESGSTFNGRYIEAVYRTPDLTFDDSTLRKVFQKLAITTQLDGNIDVVTVQLLLDKEADGIIQPNLIPLPSNSASPEYGTAVYGTDIYGTFIYPMFKKNLVGSGFFGAFQFICNDASSPFRIDSFTVQFSVKGRR